MAQASKTVKRGGNQVPPPAPAQDASDSEMSEESFELELVDSSFIPEYMNQEYPIPRGVDSFEHWGQTLVTMPKFKAQKWSFQEIAGHGLKDAVVKKYLRWIIATYGSSMETKKDKKGRLVYKHEPGSQATDLAYYLGACDWKQLASLSEAGYNRQFK
ncbi:unnamed protein product [Durusdinium trenchii]|uniref:Uncharacterized protein n=1 Tax=Durusdinium trenchii TaxID=1381693 RepID=A0ABP0QAG3_9DINO